MNRRALLAAVHCARRDLGLNEDTYRSVLERVTGSPSASRLTDFVGHDGAPDDRMSISATANFAVLWSNLYGWTDPAAWQSNPWVWRIAFRRIA